MGIEAGGLSGGQMTSAFGAGFSAVGAYTQAKNQQAALQAEAQVQQNNAQLATWQGEDSIARGEVAASNAMVKGGQVKGAQRAAMAANGVDLGGGSAQNILNDTDYLTAVDAATLRDNAAREAWGYRMQSRSYTDKAASARSGASGISPWLSAGTSLLTSATSVAGKWYQGGSTGGSRDGFSSWAYSGNRGMGD